MKYALITGAGGGIGGAVARRLAKDGYAVIASYNKSKEEALRLAAELVSSGYEAFAVQADVADSESVNEAVRFCLNRAGHIDTLVCCAGESFGGLLSDMTDGEWSRIIGVNLTGVFNCCRAVIPSMVSRKSGKIITVSSMWGQTGASCEAAYSAAKAGVIGLTKALAKELAPSGVQVNCVSPGAVETRMLSCYTQEEISALCGDIPLGRLGLPGEIAGAVSYLAGEDAEYITGQVLAVNGGMVI